MILALAALLLQDPPAAFRYDVGQELRYRQKGEVVASRKVLADDAEGTLLDVVSTCDLRLKVLKREGKTYEVQATPLSYRIEFKNRGRVIEFKEGSFSDTRMEDPAEGLTAPFTLTIAESGLRTEPSVKRPSHQMIMFFMMDVLPSPLGSLTGWFGAIPDGSKPGQEWKTTAGLMLAREDFLFIESTAVMGKGSARTTFRVDRERTKYPWVATAKEEGEGSIEFDAKARASAIKIAWSARTKEGDPLIAYKSEITLTPEP